MNLPVSFADPRYLLRMKNVQPVAVILERTRSLASNLNPIFQVGKSSLTPELTAAIGESFNNNELIKIGVLKNCFDDPRAIAEMVAERTHSQVVQVIGKKIVLYKPDKDKPKIELPR